MVNDDNHEGTVEVRSDEQTDGSPTWKQNSEPNGGMRRVDSLDLARLRLPESCARSKTRKSKLGGDKKDSEMRSSRTSVSAGILNIIGMGSSSSQMVRA